MTCVFVRKERNGSKKRVKLGNDIYQTEVVNECFNALETLIYVFSSGLMIWQYPNPLFKIRGEDLKTEYPRNSKTMILSI